MHKKNIETLITNLLKELGENPEREGLRKTSKRVADMLAFLTSGNSVSLKTIINDAIFTQENNSMIVVKDIEVYSTCEHHLLPFFGKCHIGYVSDGKIIGVSKMARIVDMFARRLQLQERLTEQVAKTVMDVLCPKGVGVMIEAQHLCMMMRGVEKQNSIMVTSSVLGNFRSNIGTREEFLSIIRTK